MGQFARRIKRMRKLYRARGATLAQAVAPYAADSFTTRLQDGGTHLLIDVREDPDYTFWPRVPAKQASLCMR